MSIFNLKQSGAVCASCGKRFRKEDRAAPDANDAQIEQIKYCSERCARKAENKRYYETHKEKIKGRVRKRRR